jgi:hypothetical protein
MTISTLHATIQNLASQFAQGVLDAIRSASLDDILTETGGGGRRARASVAVSPSAAAVRRRGDRLPRRSASDIAETVDAIVALLASKPQGLRAEKIRAELGLEAKELPRPISEALRSHRITKKGQKRATTYFAKAGGRATAPRSTQRSRSARKQGAKRARPARASKRGKRAPAAQAAQKLNGKANGAGTSP